LRSPVDIGVLHSASFDAPDKLRASDIRACAVFLRFLHPFLDSVVELRPAHAKNLCGFLDLKAKRGQNVTCDIGLSRSRCHGASRLAHQKTAGRFTVGLLYVRASSHWYRFFTRRSEKSATRFEGFSANTSESFLPRWPDWRPCEALGWDTQILAVAVQRRERQMRPEPAPK
jgi:hypothetical protein